MPGPLAVVAAAGSVLQLYGKIRQGQVEQQISKLNVRRLKQEAKAVVAQANEDVGYMKTVQEANRGSIIANFAARGIDVGSATPMDTILTQARIDNYNNARTLYEAEVRAVELRNQAKFEKFRGKEAKTQAILGAFGSMMSAVGGQAGGMQAPRASAPAPPPAPSTANTSYGG